MSTEAKSRLKKSLKNRDKNPPINFHSSKSSNLTVQVHRNLPLHRSTALFWMAIVEYLSIGRVWKKLLKEKLGNSRNKCANRREEKKYILPLSFLLLFKFIFSFPQLISLPVVKLVETIKLCFKDFNLIYILFVLEYIPYQNVIHSSVYLENFQRIPKNSNFKQNFIKSWSLSYKKYFFKYI
uniref:Uncharacterized protein n=1 Tax=Heterorhabditis bacteriophora TaxID=37862 RepID=A0A1I7X2C9_HETBA